jgi:hypothetical protein
LQNGAKISIGKLHLGKEKEWEASQQNINGKLPSKILMGSFPAKY